MIKRHSLPNKEIVIDRNFTILSNLSLLLGSIVEVFWAHYINSAPAEHDPVSEQFLPDLPATVG